jgi:hypothetical protein
LRPVRGFWIFEEVDPPPPMPRAIMDHMLRIDSPNVLKDLMHRALQMKRPEVDFAKNKETDLSDIN